MWSYSNNPGNSDKDYVRFTIGDTIEADQQMADEEINYLLTLYPKDTVVIKCLEHIINIYARQVDYSIGPENVKASQRFTQFTQILEGFKKDRAQKLSSPLSIQPGSGIFSTHMHCNGSPDNH